MFSNWPHGEMAPNDQVMGCRWLKSVFYPFPLGLGCLLWFRLYVYKVVAFNVFLSCECHGRNWGIWWVGGGGGWDVLRASWHPYPVLCQSMLFYLTWFRLEPLSLRVQSGCFLFLLLVFWRWGWIENEINKGRKISTQGKFILKFRFSYVNIKVYLVVVCWNDRLPSRRRVEPCPEEPTEVQCQNLEERYNQKTYV